jgi:hypothetical protein
MIGSLGKRTAEHFQNVLSEAQGIEQTGEVGLGRAYRGGEPWCGQQIVVLANSDLPDTVGVAHFPSIPADRRVIGIARLHAVCFSNSGGVAA